LTYFTILFSIRGAKLQKKVAKTYRPVSKYLKICHFSSFSDENRAKISSTLKKIVTMSIQIRTLDDSIGHSLKGKLSLALSEVINSMLIKRHSWIVFE